MIRNTDIGQVFTRMNRTINIIKDALLGKEVDLTSVSIKKAIILLAIPMVLEMIMESLFAVVDVYFVSQVSTEAIATVGLTESVLTLLYACAMGLSMAATAMISRRVGEKNIAEAGNAGAQAILLGLVLSVVVGLVGIFYAADILRLMGGSSSLIESGQGYTRILLGTNIVVILLFLLNGIFRGAGNAALAMQSLWLANGINIVLDPLLIFGWGPIPAMGIEGAALATVIGRSTGVLFQLYLLFKGRGLIQIKLSSFGLRPEIIKRLLRVAATGAGQFLISSASWVFLMRIIAELGSDSVAGYTVAIRLLIFTILPAWGLSNAAATLVGQNLGAGQPDRAEKSAWKAAKYNMIFLGLVSIVYLLAARPIIELFTTTPAVVESAVITLRILSSGYILFAYAMVITQAFNGAGDTRTPTLINLFCFWVLEIPLGYLMAITFDLGLPGVCWAIVISESMMAFIAVLLFRKGKWKGVQI